MRTLVAGVRPECLATSGYQRQWTRFLRRVGFQGMMPDLLVRGRPALALDALVLSRRDLEEIRNLTESFAQLFQYAAERIAEEPGTLERYGFPWAAAELLAQEPPGPVVLGRFDLVRDRAGRWWVLELNSDTPSGIREATVADAIVHRWLGQGTHRVNDGLAERFVESFIRALQALDPAIQHALDGNEAPVVGAHGRAPLPQGIAHIPPGGHPPRPDDTRERPRYLPDASRITDDASRITHRRLGIVTDGGEPEDLAQMAFTRELLAPHLAGLGWDVVLGDVTNLTLRGTRLHLLGRPIDALYRYYPFETLFGSTAFSAIFEAVFAGTLRLLNGLRGFLPQDKGISAWLWARRQNPEITPADRELIERHLPESYWIGDLPVDFDYSDWVLKQVFGREGEEVYFGDRLDPFDWLRCRNWGTFVVQRRIDVQPVTGIGWEGSEPVACERYPSVGAFVANGRFAGCYTRLGDRVVSNTAIWVATFADESKVTSRRSRAESPVSKVPGLKIRDL